MEQLSLCQRWKRGREYYRPGRETIRVREYGIDIVSDRKARHFIAEHHYAPNSPPQTLSVGLFRKVGVTESRLVGIARFSVPMNQHAVPKHTGQEPGHGCELGRLVLLDEVPGNGESYFLARAMRVLRQERPNIRAVVSYCDPVARYRQDGTLFKRGHIGICYQALNARHVGRAKPRTLLMTRSGHVLSERSVSKFKHRERGEAYAYRQLLKAGCPERNLGEDREVYLERALREGGVVRQRHPGNLVYCWAVGSARDRKVARSRMPPAQIYPKD